MRFPIIALLMCCITACSSLTEKRMVATTEFAHLRFLEGQWVGKGPNGTDFYEQYSFPSNSEMRSTRYSDATFSTSTDGSIVALQDGKITSIWKEFSWELSEITPKKACFIPLKAPSSFCWEQISETVVHVTQRWSDEKGVPQEYVVPLRKL
jgi:hypothetical protein